MLANQENNQNSIPAYQIFNFSYSELNIVASDITQLMGYADEVPLEISKTIEVEIEKLLSLDEIQGGYVIYDAEFVKDDFEISLGEQSFFIGKTIWQYLKKSTQIAVFTCTAGKTISDRSRKLMKDGLLIEGYTADIIGTIVVEKAMNLVQEALRKNMNVKRLGVTNRYSPGYCSWDVKEQHKLFAILPDKFCRVELNSSALMLPTKSVSGFMGIGANVKYNSYSCNQCTSKNCVYRGKKMAN